MSSAPYWVGFCLLAEEYLKRGEGGGGGVRGCGTWPLSHVTHLTDAG